jgi:acyl dehydratase
VSGATIRVADLEVGGSLPTQTFQIARADLVRYAGASGDFNPIHWSEETAVGVGLPNVIAHGMLTMAMAVRVVTDWVGDPAAVQSYAVRFSRPVVVESSRPTALQVTGTIRSLNPEAGTATVDLVASVDGESVLSRARVVIRLAG